MRFRPLDQSLHSDRDACEIRIINAVVRHGFRLRRLGKVSRDTGPTRRNRLADAGLSAIGPRSILEATDPSEESVPTDRVLREPDVAETDEKDPPGETSEVAVDGDAISTDDAAPDAETEVAVEAASVDITQLDEMLAEAATDDTNDTTFLESIEEEESDADAILTPADDAPSDNETPPVEAETDVEAAARLQAESDAESDAEPDAEPDPDTVDDAELADDAEPAQPDADETVSDEAPAAEAVAEAPADAPKATDESVGEGGSLGGRTGTRSGSRGECPGTGGAHRRCDSAQGPRQPTHASTAGQAQRAVQLDAPGTPEDAAHRNALYGGTGRDDAGPGVPALIAPLGQHSTSWQGTLSLEGDVVHSGFVRSRRSSRVPRSCPNRETSVDPVECRGHSDSSGDSATSFALRAFKATGISSSSRHSSDASPRSVPSRSPGACTPGPTSCATPDTHPAAGPGSCSGSPWSARFACGLLTHYVSKEARGHGVPEVMAAIYRRKGQIQRRIAVTKPLASIFTIGSGGSAGAEGPIVQIGSAIGSNVGRWLRTSPEHTSTLLGCGAAAGIASVFNAPIAGIFFVLEILLRDFSLRTFTPIVIASVFSAAMTEPLAGFAGLRDGSGAIFHVAENISTHTFHIFELPYFFVLGLVCGVVAVAFIQALDWSERIFNRVRVPVMVKRSSVPCCCGA